MIRLDWYNNPLGPNELCKCQGNGFSGEPHFHYLQLFCIECKCEGEGGNIDDWRVFSKPGKYKIPEHNRYEGTGRCQRSGIMSQALSGGTIFVTGQS